MRTTIILFALLGLTSPAGLADPPEDVPEAQQVVVRGRTRLADAIEAAFGGGEAASQGVGALVVDVTPYTREAADRVREAFVELADRPGLPATWHIARLGEPFGRGVERIEGLGALLPALLAKDTAVVNTLEALSASIGSLPATGGTVVYLADWHFEDDHGLEDFVRSLARKRLRFGVVGSEAAFGHAWNDGVRDEARQGEGGVIELRGMEENANDPAIGRRPFGPYDPDAPWHGGDTAYPHLPYRFSERLWKTEFSPGDLDGSDGILDLGRLGRDGFEDLGERLGRARSSGGSSFHAYPLPSAFGPYGLMRATALRAGRYVLWSWNPERRASLRYDYGRCNHYAPDLRSRAEIKKDLRNFSDALAMLKAWDLLTKRHTAVVAHTAPLDRQGRGSHSIDLLPNDETRLETAWMQKEMHRAFLEEAGEWHDAVGEALGYLEKGLGREGPPADGPARRFRADAELLHHALHVIHFELGEAIAAAKTVPADAWKDEDSFPGIRRQAWIERGDDPDAIRKTGVEIFDPAAGASVEAARVEHLRRYGGTPFGHQVGGNTVDTWQVQRMPRMKSTNGPLPGRTPSESSGDTPRTPPRPTTPGGSGGSGPSSGR